MLMWLNIILMMYSNVKSTRLPWNRLYLSGRLSNVLGSTCCLRGLYLTVRILVNVLDFLYLIYIGGD